MTINRSGQVPDSYQGINPRANPGVILSTRDAASTDRRYPLGKLWVNKSANKAFVLSSVAGSSAVWTQLGGSGGAGSFTTVTASTSVSSPLYTAGAGVDLDLTAPSGQDAVVKLGDAAGSNKLSITDSADSEVASVDSDGNASFDGNLTLPTAGSKLIVEGGAATDFIGQATLVSGTVTVANTNIAAADKVIVTREGVGSSTALGVLNVSITASTSFTITALQPGTPGSTETGDLSVVNYFIVRQA